MFRDTAIGERFLLNAVQFSAAKNDAEVKMTQALLFDDKGTRKGFSAFKQEADTVADTFHDFWFRVEYDNCVRQAVTGDQFRRYRDDADIYPYWRYLMTTSLHPRDEHLKLVDNIYRIGDPEGDKVIPPDGWNCGCGTEQVSDMEVDEGGLKVRTLEESAEDLKLVSPQFRFNPADQGILPKESHTYFEAMPNANAGDGDLFDLSGSPKNSTKLKARGMHNMLEQINDWKHEYHSTINTITFQNKSLLSNIMFTHRSFTTISKNPTGFEQLADTVMNPDEVWSQWTDADEQRNTLRTYIKGNYCVFTRNGQIVNAYLADDIHGYRAGVILPV